MESYKVSYTICGRYTIYGLNNDRDNDGKETSRTFDVIVEFAHDPDTYGNGYHMGIRGNREPFGCSVYDIRYDIDFDRNNKIGYIMAFYANKYSGKNGSWKLKELTIKEVS